MTPRTHGFGYPVHLGTSNCEVLHRLSRFDAVLLLGEINGVTSLVTWQKDIMKGMRIWYNAVLSYCLWMSLLFISPEYTHSMSMN